MRGILIVLSVLFGVAVGMLSAEDIPQMVLLDSISKDYEPVNFDHSSHTMYAEGCLVCHHEHPKNADTCMNCHEVDSSFFKKTAKSYFIGCRNCHGEYDPSNPSMPSLKVAYHSKCFQCHRGMGNVGTDPKGCTEMCHAKKTSKLL